MTLKGIQKMKSKRRVKFAKVKRKKRIWLRRCLEWETILTRGGRLVPKLSEMKSRTLRTWLSDMYTPRNDSEIFRLLKEIENANKEN